MASGITQWPATFEAGADLSGSYLCGVTLDANGKAVLPSAGGSIVGILQTKPTSGRAATVIGNGYGILPCTLGGTVTLPSLAKVDAAGKFIAASAADGLAGLAVGVFTKGGALNEEGAVILFGASGGAAAEYGVDDIVLGTTAPGGLASKLFVQTTGTKTGAMPDGKYTGQRMSITQSVAASTPVGTLTGKWRAYTGGGVLTTLALGTATAKIGDVVWDGAAWRFDAALGGTASGLS